MITKDTIVTKSNIKDIKKYLYEDLYNNYDSKFDIEYIDIENLNNNYIREERIHTNIKLLLSSMMNKYVINNTLPSFVFYSNFIFIINKKHYKTIMNKLYGKHTFTKDYDIRYIEPMPENLIGVVSTGFNVGSMGFTRIITKKEINIINIIK